MQDLRQVALEFTQCRNRVRTDGAFRYPSFTAEKHHRRHLPSLGDREVVHQSPILLESRAQEPFQAVAIDCTFYAPRHAEPDLVRNRGSGRFAGADSVQNPYNSVRNRTRQCRIRAIRQHRGGRSLRPATGEKGANQTAALETIGTRKRKKPDAAVSSDTGLNAVITGFIRAMHNYLPGRESDTVRTLRPFARRRASTLRPSLVSIRDRNPCLFARLRLLGWYVRFIYSTAYSYASVFQKDISED